MSQIKSKILDYLKQRGIKEAEFNKESGIVRGVLKSTSGISEDNIARFIAYDLDHNNGMRISLDWLFRDEGPMYEPLDRHAVQDPREPYGNNVQDEKLDKVIEHLGNITDSFAKALKDSSEAIKSIKEED